MTLELLSSLVRIKTDVSNVIFTVIYIHTFFNKLTKPKLLVIRILFFDTET